MQILPPSLPQTSYLFNWTALVQNTWCWGLIRSMVLALFVWYCKNLCVGRCVRSMTGPMFVMLHFQSVDKNIFIKFEGFSINGWALSFPWSQSFKHLKGDTKMYVLFLLKIGSFVNYKEFSKFKKKETSQVLRLSLIEEPYLCCIHYARKLSVSG